MEERQKQRLKQPLLPLKVGEDGLWELAGQARGFYPRNSGSAAWLTPLDALCTSDLRNSKMINLCCFKSLSLW